MLERPLHGGGVDRAMAELGLSREQIVDFSASINPLGPPQQVLEALQQALPRISDYPDPEGAELRRALAAFHQLPEQNLLPGSGSTELIYLLPQLLRPRRALLIQPCFSEYAPALCLAGCVVDRLDLNPEVEFAFDISQLLAALRPETELVVLANPGNPSGVAYDPALLLDLADRLAPRRLLVDEAFVDFCPEGSLVSQVVQRDNLLVLRSLTKFYAIPGLRVGYLAGGTGDIVRLASVRPPWALSNLALEAGRACLAATDYRSRTLESIPPLRRQMQTELRQFGCQVFPGAANYLLCRLPDASPPASQLALRLRLRGLLVRPCVDLPPLDDRYLRLAVLSEGQNRRLLAALAKELL